MHNVPKLIYTGCIASLVPLFTLAQNKTMILAAEDEPSYLFLSNYRACGSVKSVQVSIYFVCRNFTGIDSAFISKTIDQKFDEKGKCVYEKTIDFYNGKTEQTDVLIYKNDRYNSLHFNHDSSKYRREKWKKVGRKHVKHTSFNPYTDTIDTQDDIVTTRHRGRLVIEKTVIDNYDEHEVTTYLYALKHRILEQNNYTDRQQWLKKVWQYDAQRILMADTTFYLDKGNTTMMYIVTYDTSGNIVERLSRDIKYGKGSRQTYVYDAKNRMVEWNRFLNGGKLEMKGELTYDTSGNLKCEIVSTPDRQIINQRNYTYNKYNLLTSATLFGNGLADSFRYARKWEGVDKYDNWQKVTEYKNGEPMRITVRKIEYYK